MRRKHVYGEKVMNIDCIINTHIDSRQIAKDVEAVVTSFNQGSMILEAIHSLCCQTTPPAKIILVDDGSTDGESVRILNAIQSNHNLPVPVTVIQQPNAGVSSARNTGIRQAQTSMTLVLDGDDRLKPSYIEEVSQILRNHPAMVAASSWMHTFGVLDAAVRPCGGGITAFLARNCCPATHILRHEVWEQCGGYDESMRAGFEDWDFFFSMLETTPDAFIGIVEKPLIDYRTAPASSNVTSMEKRLDLMRFLIQKHIGPYRNHVTEALLGIESISISRLYGWESEILHTLASGQEPCSLSDEFMAHPSYGDGGMAAAVRIASSNSRCT